MALDNSHRQTDCPGLRDGMYIIWGSVSDPRGQLYLPGISSCFSRERLLGMGPILRKKNGCRSDQRGQRDGDDPSRGAFFDSAEALDDQAERSTSPSWRNGSVGYRRYRQLEDPGKMVKGMGGRWTGGQRPEYHRRHAATTEGESKLLPTCTLPLTGVKCVRRS